MATPWIDSVRRRRELRVYKHESMDRGIWQGLFDRALSEFNDLSRQNRLGVTMSATQERPARRGTGGAEVMVRTASDQVVIPYEGASASIAFDGTGLHGKTWSVLFETRGERRVGKAFVYLPAEPTPRNERRAAGAPVCLAILVHELVHCCGLSDRDHVYNMGIFRFPLSFIAGPTPAGDRVELGRYGADNLPVGMPPFELDDQTIGRIRALWQPASTESPAETEGDGQRQSRGPIGIDSRYASLGAPRFRLPGPDGMDA